MQAFIVQCRDTAESALILFQYVIQRIGSTCVYVLGFYSVTIESFRTNLTLASNYYANYT